MSLDSNNLEKTRMGERLRDLDLFDKALLKSRIVRKVRMQAF